MLKCKGVVFFTGVGKSGFIAQKISMTLVSTGTKAVFLNPVDALHGDIGVVGEDILVLFSKSGSTELLGLVPFAKARGARLVSVTCLPGSKLARACDSAIVLPLERELCPFDLAPVTSTAIQLLFGDTVAIAVMEEKGLSRDAYAKNHPAGRIGKRLLLQVADVMDAGDRVPTSLPGTKVVEVLMELSKKGRGCVLVVDEERRLLGTFSDGDLRRGMQRMGAAALDCPVSELMGRNPRSVPLESKAVDALEEMEHPEKGKVSFIPVLDEAARVKGLLTLHMLLSAGLYMLVTAAVFQLEMSTLN